MVEKYISHRGNVNGPEPKNENNPIYIEKALTRYDCEVDLRYELSENQFYLGHDINQYPININWLIKNKNKLWIHCKDFYALNYLSNNQIDLNFFWHHSDDYTITSQGYIWTYPEKLTGDKSVIVDLELNYKSYKENPVYGVCSDFISKLDK